MWVVWKRDLEGFGMLNGLALPPAQRLSSHLFPSSRTETCPGPRHPHQPELYFLMHLPVPLSVLNTDPSFYDGRSSLPDGY